MFRAELEQFDKRVEQRFEYPRNPPTWRRRERLLRRGARVEEKEYDRGFFRIRMIMIWLLVTGCIGGDLENLGIGKIIIWETLR